MFLLLHVLIFTSNFVEFSISARSSLQSILAAYIIRTSWLYLVGDILASQPILVHTLFIFFNNLHDLNWVSSLLRFKIKHGAYIILACCLKFVESFIFMNRTVVHTMFNIHFKIVTVGMSLRSIFIQLPQGLINPFNVSGDILLYLL